MAKPSRTRSALDSFFIFLCGTSVGILVGLSVSPVVHIVVASLVAVIVSLVAVLSGLRAKEEASDAPLRRFRNLEVKTLPFAALTLGLVFGAGLGTYARTNGLLGVDPKHEVQRWSGTGLDDASIQRRIFDDIYPPSSSATANDLEKSATTEQNNAVVKTDSRSADTPTDPNRPSTKQSERDVSPRTAGLFALDIRECELLAGKTGEVLRTRLKGLNYPRVNASLERCDTDACLEKLRAKLCPQ